MVQKLQEEKSLSGVLFLITQRASALHISSAASPQVIPVLSLYCLPLPPNWKTLLALIKVRLEPAYVFKLSVSNASGQAFAAVPWDGIIPVMEIL